VKATFRVEGREPEWWDPFSGRVSPAIVEAQSQGGQTITLDLEPYGSRVLVFSRRTLPRPTIKSGPAIPASIDLSSGWRVSFGQSAKPILMERLQSWTENDATRYFSGVAAYEKEVILPKELVQDGLIVRLDFGEGKQLSEQSLRAGMQAWLDGPVREAAVVYINERRAGSVWCPPYSLDVTSFLHSGENKIRILVGNLALNYMSGRRLPDYRLLNLRYGERFQAQDMDKVQAVPAGLLGPIRLLANRSSKP
jgi:hypothetical protein